jgi:cysteine-rich repeat protein
MKPARGIRTVVVVVTLLGAVGASAGTDEGLVAYWPLDGSAADATGNGYNGVLVGNVTFVPGVRGGAASFDGLDDRISIVGKVPYQNEYTFSGWIRFDGPPQNDWNLVFVRGSSCNDASQDLGTYYSTKTITVDVCDFSYPWYLRAPFELVNGRWYHLAATVRPGEVRIYLDGVMVAEQALTGVIDTDTCYVEHAIGGMSSSILGGPWSHNGLIDEVRVYNRALSAAEIAQLYFCGNGVVDPDEECDDGNTNPSDGCTNACTVCGNGTITPPERCDDGNRVNGDGCDSNCTMTACGNGVRGGFEQCDDGNTNSCDGCSPTCRNEPAGYRCGDGVVVSACAEECDDGNRINEDACRSDCRRNVCGDGFRNPATEQCDDGNTTPEDGCSASCRTEFCGDGARQEGLGEECDDGNTNNGDACRNDCFSTSVATASAIPPANSARTGTQMLATAAHRAARTNRATAAATAWSARRAARSARTEMRATTTLVATTAGSTCAGTAFAIPPPSSATTGTRTPVMAARRRAKRSPLAPAAGTAWSARRAARSVMTATPATPTPVAPTAGSTSAGTAFGTR